MSAVPDRLIPAPTRATYVAMCKIGDERIRQEDGRFKWTCADPNMGDSAKLAVLVEEVGEVARALVDADRAALETELVQVAAVATAWIEALLRDRERGGRVAR